MQCKHTHKYRLPSHIQNFVTQAGNQGIWILFTNVFFATPPFQKHIYTSVERPQIKREASEIAALVTTVARFMSVPQFFSANHQLLVCLLWDTVFLTKEVLPQSLTSSTLESFEAEINSSLHHQMLKCLIVVVAVLRAFIDSRVKMATVSTKFSGFPYPNFFRPKVELKGTKLSGAAEHPNCALHCTNELQERSAAKVSRTFIPITLGTELN